MSKENSKEAEVISFDPEIHRQSVEPSRFKVPENMGSFPVTAGLGIFWLDIAGAILSMFSSLAQAARSDQTVTKEAGGKGDINLFPFDSPQRFPPYFCIFTWKLIN